MKLEKFLNPLVDNALVVFLLKFAVKVKFLSAGWKVMIQGLSALSAFGSETLKNTIRFPFLESCSLEYFGGPFGVK